MRQGLIRLKLNKVDDIKAFVNKAGTLESDISIHSDYRFIVDGKSLMGLFSLDTSKVVGMDFLEKKIGEFGEFVEFCKELEILVED